MRLPERFRAAVVLCDIEGLSYQQAAIQLRVPLGTVQSRLSRARLRLRDRLAQKGFRPEDLDGCVMPANAILANVVRASPSPALQQACDRLCTMMVADKVRLHPLVTSSVQNLTTRRLRSMWLSKWNGIALFSATAMILCGGLLWANRLQGQPRQDTAANKSGSSAAKGVANGSPIRAKSADLIVPAPKEQKAAAGRGKTLVYALDQNDKRLPRRLEDPSGHEAEVLIELLWAAVTGIVDHREIQGRVSKGRESPAITARELYRRVELERQTLSPDRVWSAWQPVDAEPTMRILDNMPEADEEKTPDELRNRRPG